VGNRRPAAGVLRSVRAVLHNDVTIHSHVRLFTRGEMLSLGSRQGAPGLWYQSLFDFVD